jgi:hypothetical protein
MSYRINPTDIITELIINSISGVPRDNSVTLESFFDLNNLNNYTTWLIIICIVLIIAYNYYKYISEADNAECLRIMREFYLDPDYDDFCKIYNTWHKLEQEFVTFWLYGVYLTQPQFFNEPATRWIEGKKDTYNRCMRAMSTTPTKTDIRSVWMLYTATAWTYHNIDKMKDFDPV